MENTIPENRYKVGDKVWVWIHYMLVQGTILALNDEFVKQSPDAFMFYDLDIPHFANPLNPNTDFAGDEFYENKETAIKYYKEHMIDDEYEQNENDVVSADESDYDVYEKLGIYTDYNKYLAFECGRMSERADNGIFTQEEVEKAIKSFPSKVKDVEWFNMQETLNA